MSFPNEKQLYILLAEDDADDREFFMDGVEKTGLDIHLVTVADGEQLSKTISGIEQPPPPHFIFLDINMPRKNGKACLKEIRANKFFNPVPVIMLSTSSNPRDVEETYKSGASRYIFKSDFAGNEALVLKKLLASESEQLISPTQADYVFNVKQAGFKRND